ncbi:unnamed protein product [Gadus morhua 'NCC']
MRVEAQEGGGWWPKRGEEAQEGGGGGPKRGAEEAQEGGGWWPKRWADGGPREPYAAVGTSGHEDGVPTSLQRRLPKGEQRNSTKVQTVSLVSRIFCPSGQVTKEPGGPWGPLLHALGSLIHDWGHLLHVYGPLLHTWGPLLHTVRAPWGP